MVIRSYSSFSTQLLVVYNSQLCAEKHEAVRQGREGIQGGGL